MNQPWRAQAACRGLDSTIFFPDPDDEEAEAAAKAVCETCPVKEPCLEYALGFREREGIWGATSERDRRRIVRQRRKSA